MSFVPKHVNFLPFLSCLYYVYVPQTLSISHIGFGSDFLISQPDP